MSRIRYSSHGRSLRKFRESHGFIGQIPCGYVCREMGALRGREVDKRETSDTSSRLIPLPDPRPAAPRYHRRQAVQERGNSFEENMRIRDAIGSEDRRQRGTIEADYYYCYRINSVWSGRTIHIPSRRLEWISRNVSRM